jgi:pyrimidine oxygenase
LHVVKRLWTEDSVTFDGDWFHLRDCRSSPRPVQKPHPFLICSGTSDEGFRFAAQEANYSFVGGRTPEHTKQLSLRMKEIAAEYGRTIKSATTLLPILADTEAEAQKQWKHIQDGADTEALDTLINYFTRVSRESAQSRIEKMKSSVCYTGRIFLGTPAMMADLIEELVVDSGVDSIQLLWPDYIKGLKQFHAEVLPQLQRRELRIAS